MLLRDFRWLGLLRTFRERQRDRGAKKNSNGRAHQPNDLIIANENKAMIVDTQILLSNNWSRKEQAPLKCATYLDHKLSQLKQGVEVVTGNMILKRRIAPLYSY